MNRAVELIRALPREAAVSGAWAESTLVRRAERRGAPRSRHLRLLGSLLLSAAIVLAAGPPAEAGLEKPAAKLLARCLPLLLKAPKVVRDFLLSYGAGKGVDWLTKEIFPDPPSEDKPAREAVAKLRAALRQEIAARDKGDAEARAAVESLRSELRGQMGELVRAIAESARQEREVLEEQLALVRQQIEVLDRSLRAQQDEIAGLWREQEEMSGRLAALETRVARLENRADQLESRVGLLEDALLTECLDLRTAASFGGGGYRVKGTADTVKRSSETSDEAEVSLWLLLDTCKADLTERGLLVQVSLLTRGLSQDLALWATFKDISPDGWRNGQRNYLSRLELPLDRPAYELDGQVREFFIPYETIPFPSSTDKIAIALVLTHDGGPIYSLPDQVFSCQFGRRTQCRWQR